MAITTQDRSELVNELLERIAQTVGENAKASTTFGDPVERAGVTVVPVAKARFGFGGGGGSGTREEGEGQGRGGGAGMAVSPVGFIELRDNRAEFKRMSTPEICWRSSQPPRLPSSVSGLFDESLVAAGRRGGAHRLRRLDDGSKHEDLSPVRTMLDTDGVHELTDHAQAAST
jgi:uncharacterized spore protein YtfJ